MPWSGKDCTLGNPSSCVRGVQKEPGHTPAKNIPIIECLAWDLDWSLTRDEEKSITMNYLTIVILRK